MDFNPIDGVIRETKSHPYTMLTMIGLCIFSGYAAVNFARAQDVRQIQTQISQLTRYNVEQQLAAVNTELFSLTQQVNDKVAGHKPVDAVYYTRINELSNEKGRLERLLQGMH